jgi:hypothetical protein
MSFLRRTFARKLIAVLMCSSFAVSAGAQQNEAKSNGCQQQPSSIMRSQTGNAEPANYFAFSVFDKYVVNFNDWGQDPGTLTQWINGPSCWGVSTTTQKDVGIKSYPHVSRGWSNNAGVLEKLSTSGYPKSPNWTSKSGLGIRVSNLPKVSAKWNISTPASPNYENAVSRWIALIDIYLHTDRQGGPNPPATAWPPQIDIQIMQMLMDQPLRGQRKTEAGYFAYKMSRGNYFVKTISQNTYIGVIDMDNYNASGGHTITLMATPTMVTHPSSTGPLLWGQSSMKHRVDELISWLSQPRPLDDSGKNIKNAKGEVVTEPLIDPSWYLTAINAGFEISFGTPAEGNNKWATTDFRVSVGSENDRD